MIKMACKCGHQLKDHEWTLIHDGPQPCTLCDCKDFKDEDDDNAVPVEQPDGFFKCSVCGCRLEYYEGMIAHCHRYHRKEDT